MTAHFKIWEEGKTVGESHFGILENHILGYWLSAPVVELDHFVMFIYIRLKIKPKVFELDL